MIFILAADRRQTCGAVSYARWIKAVQPLVREAVELGSDVPSPRARERSILITSVAACLDLSPRWRWEYQP
jgi:hypothetical protein